MFASERIRQVATDAPSVYAFRIEGGVSADELAAMSRLLDEAFERHDKISMLLLLDGFGPSDALSSISPKSLATQARSAFNVERYAVVGPPPSAARMIETFDTVSSIDARTFDPGEEDAAWDFVGARPAK